ncbi:MAG TPA: DUF1343 domain-containing protein [Kiritimatiellia bacterium]|nr:DUF1343 domain-containing protein [Kiritimatiellia bacterium]HMO98721.1 DUF1343 domain-containing protein [Kiritimatiellia bacterium]HMP96881.1 DUF1343 domain-containing protein [Kiritimatiellia bacterium]
MKSPPIATKNDPESADTKVRPTRNPRSAGNNAGGSQITALAKLLGGRRFGLVAHAASVDELGAPVADRLRAECGDALAALFSPEHGYFGVAGAGEKVASLRHPVWNIPIHSLYGKTRRPAPAMLRGLEALVFDLRTLSIRCYTYVSTLRYLLEAAAAQRLPVIVLDQTNPLDAVADGPMLDSRFESFVGNFPGPLVYGLTTGEAAHRLAASLRLRLDLTIMAHGGGNRADTGHRWISPSPGIRNPHTARCYPVTVGFEALPAIDYGRQTLTPFELIGARDLDETEWAKRLAAHELPGIAFHPVIYENRGAVWRGVRIAVTQPSAYAPVRAAVTVLYELQRLLGIGRLWRSPGSRPAFFDRLYGTDTVRRALLAGQHPGAIANAWRNDLRRWRAAHPRLKDLA